MMVVIALKNLREKMRMVPGWSREGPGDFARIAENEKHVTCRSGKRGSGGARITPEDKAYPYYQTFYFVTRGIGKSPDRFCVVWKVSGTHDEKRHAVGSAVTDLGFRGS